MATGPGNPADNACCLLTCVVGCIAVAQETSLDQEIWRKSQIFRQRPSFATTPVVVRMASSLYRILRNYLPLEYEGLWQDSESQGATNDGRDCEPST